MRLTLHWRGSPLVAVDLTAQSPADEDPSLAPPMGLSAGSGGLTDKSEPMEPDTRAIGFGPRPESRND